MKIQPSLFLTHFCILLATSGAADAQSPQPRFGYGSVPGGAYVIPAPKKVSQPAAAAKPKPKPATASTQTKPKPVASTTKPAAAKTVTARTTIKSPAVKPGSTKAPTKAVVSNKTKAAPSPAKPAPKTQLAKTASPSSRSKSPVVSEKTQPKPALVARAAPPASTKSAVAASSRKAPTSTIVAAATATTHSGLADLTQPGPAVGFHFFGVPMVLPGIAPGSIARHEAADSRHFVDVMAARHSLDKTSPANSARPQPTAARPVQTAFVPAIAPHPVDGHTFHPAESERESAVSAVKPAVYALTTHVAGPTDPSDTLAELEPATRGANGMVAAHAEVAPKIAPLPLAAQDFQPSDPLPANSRAEILEEPSFSRSIPASLSLAASISPVESAPEATQLDEPALPSPVLSVSAQPAAPKAAPQPAAEIEPPLPVKASPAASVLTETIAEAADENDLSERERAFVRSLAEAAGNVTTASGQLNNDLPSSIATAATAVIDQIPAETVSTFRSVAATVKKTAKKTVSELVPELPMEISNDLMPATPEKMPDRLPDFNAPASGKIDVQSDRQADYDQANNKVIFTGKVELNSAAMRLRAERVEVFMKKGGGGMERVEATGNVLMRTQDNANGPGQMASAGRASYNLKTGEITLADWPKIQETGKSHISTDPSTKMYMFTDGRLRTDGPNRTIIGGQ